MRRVAASNLVGGQWIVPRGAGRVAVAAPMAFFPFGGARNSFYGDLKAQGKDAVAFYTDQKVVISRW